VTGQCTVPADQARLHLAGARRALSCASWPKVCKLFGQLSSPRSTAARRRVPDGRASREPLAEAAVHPPHWHRAVMAPPVGRCGWLSQP
jgi:hypothetical protein